ncbi:UDP-N-acetylmuramoyl-L-alanine--D-glutamate ligase [Siminovitchia acidinfaciens]|uniref:UDP-N-acetylmuramoylalanine--D-glutamate ligase n=1 Tax=Siminovitchia acidinfaciens TaxID=2321395 RepID=A0A429Y2I1_9BACI|nr:UDP-N-acetylmuramoyl-L-alanine--D-glutamate ligase [Siminovitchia acidinfaciens]RST75404.1 UDP-N-acetylmuramoyl-L-alanine--D-glutamate ligase [Siminovitchia acidinfaciens]
MKKITDYEHKKILVLGLAKSGIAAASLLHELGAFVTVNDQKPFEENTAAQSLLEKGIKVICGSHPPELLDEGFELIVKNPGIPYTNPLVSKAMEMNIPIITEIELAYRVSEADIIGITGSNGKTTTTTLIFNMLEEASKNPLIAGNIGTVASEVAMKATSENQMVVELSSFQLMGVDQFKPHIAIITNVYEAHLDYHQTKENYAEAKANITRNQTEDDFLIVNADQEELLELVSFSQAELIPFSTVRYLEKGVSIKEGKVFHFGEEVIGLRDILLPGKHNQENILAAIAAVKILGVGNDAIKRVLATFQGVEHRTQFVAEVNGRRFYNDSKATNILATKSALQAFDQPVVLLAGGLDRGNSFSELVPHMSGVKALILFGETADKLEEAGREAGIQSIYHVDNVEEAVPLSFNVSEPGDVVLLSPACASWDQYKTFEVRGNIFAQAVHKLKQSQ